MRCRGMVRKGVGVRLREVDGVLGMICRSPLRYHPSVLYRVRFQQQHRSQGTARFHCQQHPIAYQECSVHSRWGKLELFLSTSLTSARKNVSLARSLCHHRGGQEGWAVGNRRSAEYPAPGSHCQARARCFCGGM